MTTSLQSKRELDAFVQEHPMGAVAAALGVGYLVGGGLFTRTTGKLLSLGWALGLRFAVADRISERVVAEISVIGSVGK